MNKRMPWAALLLAPLLFACADLIVQPAELDLGLADFDAVYRIVKENYAFLEFKQINWDSLRAVYRPRASASKGDRIYPLLHELLAHLKDGHVEIRTEGGFPVVTYDWPRRLQGYQSYNPLVVRNYFAEELKLAGNRRIEFQMLPNGIGYVHVPSFSDSDGAWAKEFDHVLEYLLETRGLIFDVRNNTGGSSAPVDFITSRFVTAPVTYSFFHPGDRIAWTTTIVPNGPFRYNRPVVILINGVSFSAAELFAEVMKQIPTVCTIGDTTGGGGGANQVFRLPSGKRIRIPVTYFKRFNGGMVEWNGIPPDIRVVQTKEDLDHGRDLQLERSIEWLLESTSPAVTQRPQHGRKDENIGSRNPEVSGGHE